VKYGFFSLVLHAHLPYIHHPEFDFFLEEDWLFEAITETYIPLLQVFERLSKDGIHFRITISLTPTLLAMLDDSLLKIKYRKHLNNLIALAKIEIKRTNFDKKLNNVARMYLNHFNSCYDTFFNKYNGDIINEFKRFKELGNIEIITSAATHGYLPILNFTPKAVSAQIKTAVHDFKRYFGEFPNGIWLPECGFIPGFDEILNEADLKFFFLDAHGVVFGNPRPTFGNYAPIKCPSGIHAFARDLETSKMVWSQEHGYPGDLYYREFYRDIGFELSEDDLKPFLREGEIRKNTGIKYYRITDRSTHEKMIYDPVIARQRACEHAEHFFRERLSQVIGLKREMKKKPIIVSTYDAELFGHWWYEGPIFIEQLFRKMHSAKSQLLAITPYEYLQMYPVNQMITPASSSWGDKGYHEFWLNSSNDWTYPHLYEAGVRMNELALRFKNINNNLKRRALSQAARELMLAQSSDWSFIMKTGTTVKYATNRFRNHIARFFKIYDELMADSINEQWLEELEFKDNIFPEIDYSIYE